MFRLATTARLAADANGVRTFVVAIERGDGEFSGSLRVQEPDGTTVAREVAGIECAEVATALALATALAIDPRVAPSPAPRAEQPPVASPPKPASPPASWSWNAALGPSLQAGISPRLALGGAAFLESRTPARGAAVSALGIELGWLQSLVNPVSTASASFQFLLARPLLCSVEVELVKALGASPCLAAELGIVTGSGADLPEPATETRLWAAANLLLRLRLQPSTAWFAELQGALVLPFTRYEFSFRDPDTEVYRVPRLAGSLGARLGLRL